MSLQLLNMSLSQASTFSVGTPIRRHGKRQCERQECILEATVNEPDSSERNRVSPCVLQDNSCLIFILSAGTWRTPESKNLRSANLGRSFYCSAYLRFAPKSSLHAPLRIDDVSTGCRARGISRELPCQAAAMSWCQIDSLIESETLSPEVRVKWHGP